MSAMFKGVVLLLFFVSLPNLFVAGDEGSDFLDSKEQELAIIVNETLINTANQCEYHATCGGPANCSHDACSLEDTGGFRCIEVFNNQYCPVEGKNATCKGIQSMNIDYSRSYLRLAETATLESVETQLTICSQRSLDLLFKRLSGGRDLWRAYFAGMDGSYRMYPGTPKGVDSRGVDECRIFDPRARPWFRTATSVVKIDVILIDIGASMGNNLPPDLGRGTIFGAAKNMTTQLLRTLSQQDYVNIILFDSSRVIQLSPKPVQVQEHEGTAAPELEIFATELNKYTVEEQHRPSNLSAALLAALPNFDANAKAAKVIIVITDGVFTEGMNVTIPTTTQLYDSSVKIFMYKLKQPSDNNTFLENNALIRQLCAVGGHFEPVLKNLGNPLLVFRQYFTYLANLKRVLTNGKPHYSQVYIDQEATWGPNIATVSQPVFYEGNLIGVVGITIHKDRFNGSMASLDAALRSRNTGYPNTAPDVLLTAANCTSVNETIQACGSSIASASGVLCKRTDSPKSMKELMCCGTNCRGSMTDEPLAGGAIAGIVVASVLAVLVATVLLIFYVLSKRIAQTAVSPDRPPPILLQALSPQRQLDETSKSSSIPTTT